MANASGNPEISFIAIPQFTGGYFIADFRVRGSAALEKADKAGGRSIARSAKTTSRDICLENLGILQLSASLRYIRFRCSSAFESVFGKPQRPAIGLHRLIEQLFFCVGIPGRF
jgi:hypothetical protein